MLLLDVNDEGALGVVLNRPSQVLVADVLEPWREVVAEPEVLFRGGPVGTDGALAVARLRDAEAAPVGWRPVAGLLGMVDLDTPTELVDGSLTAMRVFAGYAGWGAGQLDGEVEEGSWYVVTSEAGDAFRGDPERPAARRHATPARDARLARQPARRSRPELTLRVRLAHHEHHRILARAARRSKSVRRSRPTRVTTSGSPTTSPRTSSPRRWSWAPP